MDLNVDLQDSGDDLFSIDDCEIFWSEHAHLEDIVPASKSDFMQFLASIRDCLGVHRVAEVFQWKGRSDDI